MATLVFVGKSLKVGGGHNIIEPGLFAKPVLVGPYMENFLDVMKEFQAEQAVVQVSDPASLRRELERLLSCPEDGWAMGRRAVEVIRRNRGAIDRTMRVIVEGSSVRQ